MRKKQFLSDKREYPETNFNVAQVYKNRKIFKYLNFLRWYFSKFIYKKLFKIFSKSIVKVSIYSETVYNNLTAHDKIIYQNRPLNTRHETNRIPQKSIRLIS